MTTQETLNSKNTAINAIINKETFLNVWYFQDQNLIAVVGGGITDSTWLTLCQVIVHNKNHLRTSSELNINFRLQSLNKIDLSYIFKIIKRLNESFKDKSQIKINCSWNLKSKKVVIKLRSEARKLRVLPLDVLLSK